MPDTVGPSGPLDAEIVLIGEIPASQEFLKGKPFVGEAGDYLTMLLQSAGLDRESFYITNVVKERAPGYKIENVPYERLVYWKKVLVEELNALPNVKALVPLGNTALNAVAGRNGIFNYRGSVLEPLPIIKHNCIVLPTLHPSIMHYDYEQWPLIVADFSKLRGFWSQGWTLPPLTFKLVTRPNLANFLSVLQGFLASPEKILTLDVETPHNLLSCIGIAWSRTEAISIPFFWGNGSNYWSEVEEEIVWKTLAEILPQLNITNQNFLFDWQVLREHGIVLKMPTFDPMLMHHCLYSTMRHKLDLITSIYTDIPFYKKDEKEEKGSALKAGQEQNHWIYNCKDACAALWSIEELKKELEEEKMMDFYIKFYAELFEPIYQMNLSGVRINKDALREHRKNSVIRLAQLTEEINQAAGHPVNIQSPLQVKNFLLKDLGLSGYKKRGTEGGVSMDEKNLIKMAHKFKIDIPLKIVEGRKIAKELGLFSEDNIYDGDRIKTQFSLGRTDTGRLASKKGIGRQGMNLQNVKRSPGGIGPRRFFIPEEGYKIGSADQKQADARVVAWLSKDPLMIATAESGEIHLRNSENLYGTRVPKDDPRYHIAKTLVHAGNYAIGKFRFAVEANVSSQEAEAYLELYHKTYPGIRGFFHEYIKEQIKTTRFLYNPFGRRIPFFGRFNDDTFKAGYAYIPQSTVGDINKLALKFISKHFKPMLELHDGSLFSIPPKGHALQEAIEVFKEGYNIEFEIWGIKHKIPIDISIGDNWADLIPVEVALT